MALHEQVAVAADISIYFCDPHSPWQRPANENISGLLRQYFPKGSDLYVHGARYLQAVAGEVNGRPRKVPGLRTSAEAMAEVLGQPGRLSRETGEEAACGRRSPPEGLQRMVRGRPSGLKAACGTAARRPAAGPDPGASAAPGRQETMGRPEGLPARQPQPAPAQIW
jgi:hypothetical protein